MGTGMNGVSQALFLTLVLFLVGFAFAWTSLAYFFSAMTSQAADLDGWFSSMRLLATTIAVVLVAPHISLRKLIAWSYWFAVSNSVLASVQIYVLLFDQEWLPSWLQYGYFFGLDQSNYADPWRQGGFVPSLQVSSLLGLIGMVLSCGRNKWVQFLVFPFLWSAVFFGARTMFLFLPFVLAFMLIRGRVLPLAWLFIVYWLGSSILGFDEFIELRYGALLNVVLNLDIGADYSSADTATHYKPIESDAALFFGNTCHRYSQCGGGDPFFSRWYMYSGIPAMISLTLVLVVMMVYSFKQSMMLGLFALAMLISSFKAEIATSSFIYPVYLICILAAMRQVR